MKTILKTEPVEAFFRRGRYLARLADEGGMLPTERIIAFEDPTDLARLVTAAKIALFRAAKERPGSLTDLARRLGRDRSAVKRDVDELARAGLLVVEEKPHPGHGRLKEVRAVEETVVMAAVLT